MKKQIPQVDYLKSVFILLMILFHLVYIGDTYPYMKKVVYSFHMPIFLILSGYLSNANKSVKAFLTSWWWLFVPYAVMELGYVIAASVLPVREEVGNLNIMNILKRIWIDPVGPYWYLHTLLISRAVHYWVEHFLRNKLDKLAILMMMGLLFWALSDGLGLMSFPNAMYFLIGVGIQLYQINYISLFSPSLWSIIPLFILCSCPSNLLQFNIAGCLIVYLTTSFLLRLYTFIPSSICTVSQFIGRNTLSLLLFSPLFTMLSRMYLPIFSFDPSGLCFASFTLVITVMGSLWITWCMDNLHLSPWFFGQKRMLKR